MDALGDPPPAVVVAFLVGVMLVNVFGYLARRRDLVGEWFEYAVFATFAPIAASTIIGWMLVFVVGVIGHLALGLYVTARWFHRPPSGSHVGRSRWTRL
ncbi:MAG: hypothetical protein HOV67_35370 [Kribbellaceae bacterium]|nr:hypothetical protein [Kribbellaceae bacterium]